jgi:hypothetical protein
VNPALREGKRLPREGLANRLGKKAGLGSVKGQDGGAAGDDEIRDVFQSSTRGHVYFN